MSLLGKITGADKAAREARRGAEAAAKATREASERDIAFRETLWGEQKELLKPFVDFGTGVMDEYAEKASTPMSIDDVYNDPGYQFGIDEGRKTYENSASSKGMALSGAQAKALTRYGNDYGSTKYSEAFNRRQKGLDNLYRMINTGAGAAGGQISASNAYGNSVSGSIKTIGRGNSQYESNIGNINAASATSGFNTLLDIGGLAVSAYGASKL